MSLFYVHIYVFCYVRIRYIVYNEFPLYYLDLSLFRYPWLSDASFSIIVFLIILIN